MFMLSLKTVCKWLAMTEFEILLNLLGMLVFTLMLALKLDNFAQQLDWFYVFMPLFLADLFQANFITIVFIRQVLDNQTKSGIFRLVTSGILLGARFIFKWSILLVLSNMSSTSSPPPASFRLQFAGIPIFVHLGSLILRSCGLKKY